MKMQFFIIVGVLWCASMASDAQVICFADENLPLFRQSELDSLMAGHEDCEIFGGNLILTTKDDLRDSIHDLSVLSNIKAFTIQLALSRAWALRDLSGLEKVEAMYSLYFIYNESLKSFEGLNNIEEVYSRCVIQHNDVLEDITALSQLHTIHWNFEFTFNGARSLDGLENLRKVGAWMQIGNNPRLKKITSLHSLDSVYGSTYFISNKSLEYIDSMDNFTYTNNLYINGNPELQSIKGMESLEYVNENVRIWNNYKLESIEGLANIRSEGLENFDIFNNKSLSVCHIKSVCDAIMHHEGKVSIFNNAPGCNSIEEVKAQCMVDIDEGVSNSNRAYIYPNPSSGEVRIGFGEARSGKIEVVDISGRKLGHVAFNGVPTVRLDVSGHPGLQIIHIHYADGRVEQYKHLVIK